MTQTELIKRYIEAHGSILPAKLYGEVYYGTMFGSETSKRCREMRKKGMLRSEPDGKFERFYLTDSQKVHDASMKYFKKSSSQQFSQTVSYINSIPAMKEKVEVKVQGLF